MPNLLQGVKIEYNIEFLMQPQETSTVTDLKKVLTLYKQSKNLLKTVPKEFQDAIDLKLKNDVNSVRNEKWKTHRSLPDKLIRQYNHDGEYSDVLTALNALPKVKISEFRNLADKFNMVIIPVEYTEVDKIFDIQKNSSELKQGLKYFNELLRQDTTTKYQSYILCPIDYYNIWEQIKSDKLLKIYYAEYFENIFQTLELIIPTQKNLYLASKTNDENLKALSLSFDTNIKTLNDKITSISSKVNKLELEFIEEKRRTRNQIERLQDAQSSLQSTVLQQQRQIEFLYCQLDPILFAIPKETDIVEDDSVSIVGLCWGEDIDEMIFDMKGITIEHKDLAEINPLNIKSKMDKDGFKLEYGKIVDGNEYILKIIKDNIQELNNKRYKNNWKNNDPSINDYKVGYDLALKNLRLILKYEHCYSGMYIKSIEICNTTDKKILAGIYCDKYSVNTLNEEDLKDNDKFYRAYEKYFNGIAEQFENYCKSNCII